LSEIAVIIVEPGGVVASMLLARLADQPFAIEVVRDPAQIDVVMHAHRTIALALLDVQALGRDDMGRERPFWQVLGLRAPLPMPVICFTGETSTPTDTPLFTSPGETVTISDPQDFSALAQIVRTYVNMILSRPLLADAFQGMLLPSLRGTLADFSIEALLTLIASNSHNGVLLLREGVHTGLLACEDGAVVHALLGAMSGREAVVHMSQWQTAHFAFFHGITLGVRSMDHGMENLMLEFNRLRDEASAFAASLPPQCCVRRAKGYTDQLPGKKLTQAEWEVLSLVDTSHHIDELVRRSRHSEVIVMRALRSLINGKLVEILSNNDIPLMESLR
jgi:hypothetical protein